MDGMHVHEFFNESRDVRDALRMSQPVERMLILLETIPSKPHVRIPYETLPAVAPSLVPESIVEADESGEATTASDSRRYVGVMLPRCRGEARA